MKASTLVEYLTEMVDRNGDMEVYLGPDRYSLPLGGAGIRTEPSTGTKNVVLLPLREFENL